MSQDGRQEATRGPWELLQDSDVDTDFTLALEGVPVPAWDTAIVEVSVVCGGVLTTFTSPTDVTLQPAPNPGDPTIATVHTDANFSHVPRVGTYKVDVLLGGERLPYRYECFRVRRTLGALYTPPPPPPPDDDAIDDLDELDEREEV